MEGRTDSDVLTAAKGAAAQLHAVAEAQREGVEEAAGAALAAAAASAAATARRSDGVAASTVVARTADSAQSAAVASLLLLLQLLENCIAAADPGQTLQGARGAHWRGLLLLLLGRWAVLRAADAAAEDLQQRRALRAWRQALTEDAAFYQMEVRAALQFMRINSFCLCGVFLHRTVAAAAAAVACASFC